MQFGLLGPLVVADGAGRPVPVAGTRLRVLLAALLLQADTPVSWEALAEAVWDGAPPPGAARTLRSHLARLRRVLGAEAGRVVAREPGYLMRVQPGELDALEFEGWCLKAGSALREDAWAQASDAAARALALWRGEPLLDAPSQVLRDQYVPRLEQLRLQAHEDRAEAELHLGGCDRLVPELRDLTAQHPLRERLHAQLMLALARSGRTAEALQAYRDARRELVDQLGIEPGAELRGLHERILAGDLEPAAPLSEDCAPAASVTTVPRQLPAAVRHFTGRDAELHRLASLLDEIGLPAMAGGPVVIAANGMAGVGKTALAVHWAHLCADRFPDGQLYVDLRGFGPPGIALSAAAAVRGLLRAMGIPQDRIPVGLQAQCALYRSVLADRRMLIVLDNARDAEQVRPLLPGSAGCLVLITSRDRLLSLDALEGAHSLILNPLSTGEAHELLTRRLGAGRLAAEPQATTLLINLCARLPLALNITAARAGANPDLPLAALAGQLHHTRDRLTALEAGDAAASVRAVLSWSYRVLSRPAAHMFRLLAAHPGPDLTAAAAASLAAASRAQARHALQELAGAHLLTEHAPGRYIFANDLVGIYAAEQAHAQDPEDERRAAVHRALDHYLHSARNAVTLLDSSAAPTAPPPGPGVSPEQHPDGQHALGWLDTEHRVLLAATARAAEDRFDTHAWQLTITVASLLGQHRHWHDLADTLGIGLQAVQRLGDPAGQDLAHRYLGLTLAGLGAYGEAYTHFGQALGLARRHAHHVGQGNAHLGIAFTLGRQDRHRQALRHTGQALALARAQGDRVGQASALNATSVHHCWLGDYRQALACTRQALDLLHEAGRRTSEAPVWYNHGLAHHHLGQYRESLACYSRALDLYRQAHNRYSQADTLIRLGNSHHLAGSEHAARDAWRQALDILEEIQHPDAEPLRRNLEARPDQIALRIAQASNTLCGR